ncbi:MAG TPA: LysM domain-containing protein [Thermoguttaceae bacterium]|nr:LysM domain-containing protein [Thermoguttaceae bacterium]
MDHSVKIAAASSVLVGGILLALVFRHESPPTGQSATRDGERLVLRETMDSPPEGGGRAGDPTGAPGDIQSSGQGATVVTPMRTGTPPNLARDYPGNPTTAAWGTPMGLPPVVSEDDSPRTHRIVDGDSLANLAQRYLGSADRALEIYEANRDVLPSPQVLPIGDELTIPPRDGVPGPALPPAGPIDLGPLMPIPRDLP